MASSVEKRMAFAFPFFNMETLAMVMPTFSVSSVTLIFLLASITSMLILIAIRLYGEVVLGFDLDRVLKKLFDDSGEHADNDESEENEQGEDHGTWSVVLIGDIDDVRHGECV